MIYYTFLIKKNEVSIFFRKFVAEIYQEKIYKKESNHNNKTKEYEKTIYFYGNRLPLGSASLHFRSGGKY